MMQYEPISELRRQHQLGQMSEWQLLMMPFVTTSVSDFEPDWDMLDAVSECVSMLDEKEQTIIYGLFYDRLTYEELKTVVGVKAKSHAWTKAKTALKNLKTIMEQHPMLHHLGETNEKDRPSSTEEVAG
jgi:DNA-directed RNA polymerase specialized sigma24 family protein